MKPNSNRPAVVLATAALVISVAATGGPALAKIVGNSDKVDGLHAVKSTAAEDARKGKLVATAKKTGRLPDSTLPGSALTADEVGLEPYGRLAVTGLAFTPSNVESHGFPVTITSPSSGSLDVVLNGFRPGCDDGTPVFLATPFTGDVDLSSVSTQCDTGDVTFSLASKNAAGTPANVPFMFAIHKGPPEEGAPGEREFKTCTTTARGTTCN